MNVLPGSKVQFSVLVSGTPPLTIKWFKNKKEILSSADCNVVKDNTSSSLELFFAKTTDSGDYVCEIQNDVGSTSCQATLFVKGFYSLYETVWQLWSLSPSICSHVYFEFKFVSFFWLHINPPISLKLLHWNLCGMKGPYSLHLCPTALTIKGFYLSSLAQDITIIRTTPYKEDLRKVLHKA